MCLGWKFNGMFSKSEINFDTIVNKQTPLKVNLHACLLLSIRINNEQTNRKPREPIYYGYFVFFVLLSNKKKEYFGFT